MKKDNLLAFVTAALVLLCFFCTDNLFHQKEEKTVTAGFLYVGDAANPYSKNFMRAQSQIEETYGDRVNCIAKYNIPVGQESQYIRELIDEGCDIIFGTSYDYSPVMKQYARENPDVVFCQATGDNADGTLGNYHTYMGHIYEGRYVSGMVAGLKLREMILSGEISREEALVGYVAAYPYPEVISGYTAFLLGVRSTCPVATMKVKYAGTWNGYAVEKRLARELIDEGCVVISQHSDTSGPSAACEEAKKGHSVYHVSYNQSMKNVAPTTSLIGCRINWSPYEVAAVGALLADKPIEKSLGKGVTVNGTDAGAGFSRGWVEMLELNAAIAPSGAEEEIRRCIEGLQTGSIQVFSGNYTGRDPVDPSDTIDLSTGYWENADSSSPSFHYVLDDVIRVE